jgi:hypothetical protein
MKYDLSKTLNENVGVVNNTKINENILNTYNTTGDEYLDNLLSRLFQGAGSPGSNTGTDEDQLMDGVSKITTKNIYNKVNEYLSKNPYGRYKSLADILNGELESDNGPRVKQAQQYLNKAGVVLSYEVDKYDRFKPNTIKIDVRGGNTKPEDGFKKTNTGKKTSGYKQCSGTYKIGCKSNSIAKVQGCLGLVADGKYGRKTNAKLKDLGYNSFTDADIEKICQSKNTAQPETMSPWMKSQMEKIKTPTIGGSTKTPTTGVPATGTPSTPAPAEDSNDLLNS